METGYELGKINVQFPEDELGGEYDELSERVDADTLRHVLQILNEHEQRLSTCERRHKSSRSTTEENVSFERGDPEMQAGMTLDCDDV